MKKRIRRKFLKKIKIFLPEFYEKISEIIDLEKMKIIRQKNKRIILENGDLRIAIGGK